MINTIHIIVADLSIIPNYKPDYIDSIFRCHHRENAHQTGCFLPERTKYIT